MPGSVRLVFGVHSHQPLGNFEDVLERAWRDAYEPFLAALERHPSIRTVLHYSGCLCEWLDRRAPEHLDRIGRLVRSGQVEILTGAFYEPILPLIPPNDRVGQIRLQTRYIADRFGARAKGMWLPERVWEPTLPQALREAGVEYTLLDDYHFLASLDDDPLGGSWLTDEQGAVVRLYPISERLRYLVPFREVDETIAFLGKLAEGHAGGPEPVAVIVDDGEKFGLWPGTREWVHGGADAPGWLERFFAALEKNSGWLRTSTLEEVDREIPPRGRVYLPPGSYFEMGEWSLPPGRTRDFEAAAERSRRSGSWDSEKPFLRGGYFRNFLARYEESLLVSRRVQLLSGLLDGMEKGGAEARAGRPGRARRELWRATCNCSWWHGIFGGIYLPHLRRAVAESLCRARRFAEQEDGVDLPSVRFVDANADGRADVEIQTSHLQVIVEPARGGSIRVLDVKPIDYALGATLTRYREAYHEKVLRPGERTERPGTDHASIHEMTASVSEELAALVVVDDRPRSSAVDRFLEPGATAADLAAGRPVERGDFYAGRYEAELIVAPAGQPGAVGVTMGREGMVAGRPLRLRKTLLARASGRHLDLTWRLEPDDGRVTASDPAIRFAAELNLSLVESRGRIVVAGGASGEQTLSLSRIVETGPASRLRVEDDARGLTLSLLAEPEAEIWHYPVRTVSRSESGFEAIYQGSAILLVWGGAGSMPSEVRLTIQADVRPVP